MPCGSAFFFDDPSEAALRALWQTVADIAGSSFLLSLDYPPHMTLLTAEEMDLDALVAAWAPLAASTAPLRVDLSALGVFTGSDGVVFLAPTVNRALLDLHAALWQSSAPAARRRASYYSPGVWVPHISLGVSLSPEKQAAVVQALSAQSLPRRVTIAGVIFGDAGPACGGRAERLRFTGSPLPAPASSRV